MPEHFIRPREEWLDPLVPWDHTINGKGNYYVCPPFRGWPAIEDAVIHYPGADWADPDINNDGITDLRDTIALLRAGHRGYLLGASRGYSYGYGFKIGVLGDIWEVRGFDYANAANKGDLPGYTGWNNWSISIQIVVDEADEANPLQVAAVNWLLDEIARRKGRALNLKWHGIGQRTPCCGGGMIGQIMRRDIAFGKSSPVADPDPVDPAPPVTNPGGELENALFIPTDCDAQFYGHADSNGNALWVEWTGGDADAQASVVAWRAAGIRVYDKLSLGGFTNCTLIGPLPTGDTRHTWDGSEFRRVVS